MFFGGRGSKKRQLQGERLMAALDAGMTVMVIEFHGNSIWRKHKHLIVITPVKARANEIRPDFSEKETR